MVPFQGESHSHSPYLLQLLVIQHLQGEAPPSYEEMVCDICMESCDFLRLYQQWTTPTKVAKETEAGSNDTPPLDITESGSSLGNETNSKPDSQSEVLSSTSGSSVAVACELARRREGALNQATPSRGAGYFDKNWRSQLCRCSVCKVSVRTRAESFVCWLSCCKMQLQSYVTMNSGTWSLEIGVSTNCVEL